MVKKLFGCGCLGLLVLAAIAAYIFTQTELGHWLIGLLLVYGGAMLGGALAHDTVPGTVTELNRLDPPSTISAGSLRFSYEDKAGEPQTEFRRVMYSTSNFRELSVGDEIKVWVCKSDPSIVKLVGYGTHEPDTCPPIDAE